MGELANYVKQQASKISVSCTRNTTFQKLVLASARFVFAKHHFEKTKQVASRLRETLLFFENYALVYAKHYFCSAHLAGMGAVVPLRHLTIQKNECSRLRETTLFKKCTQKLLKTLREMTCENHRCRLVHAKRYVFSETCVSPTRNTTFSRQSGLGFVAGPPPEAGHMAF